MGKYRYSIGISNKYTFGTEIEFTNVFLSTLSRVFRENNLPVKFALNHKSRGFTKYDEWYLDIDSTVTKNNKELHEYIGGELSSKILTDKPSSWQELKDICNILKHYKAMTDDTCSNHIRVSLASIKNERYFFEVLSKLIAIFDSDITRFYMGDEYHHRQSSYEYARPIGNHILEYINNVDFQSDDYFYQFTHNGIALFERRDTINLSEYLSKKLIEIRYPNGTINHKTIQNNINFTIKLIDAINKELFDPFELTKEIDANKDELRMKLICDESDYISFEKLINVISTSSEDNDDFMSQYEHILSREKHFNNWT